MPKPRVVADGPLAAEITARLSEHVEILPWSVALDGSAEPVAGIYTYGHPRVDGAMLDRLTGVRIISNYGVGVDHIVLADAAARRIPVGNTPGVLDGATSRSKTCCAACAERRCCLKCAVEARGAALEFRLQPGSVDVACRIGCSWYTSMR